MGEIESEIQIAASMVWLPLDTVAGGGWLGKDDKIASCIFRFAKNDAMVLLECTHSLKSPATINR